MKPSSALINASIQVFAIIGVMHLALPWAIYPLLVLAGVMIFVQTLTAGFAFSGKELKIAIPRNENESDLLSFMITAIYAISTYYLYTLGFVFFSGIMAAHVAIMFATTINKG